MKQCFVLVFLLSISIYSLGQPFGSAAQGYRVKKLEYHNSTGEVVTTKFLYDCYGFLIRGFWSIEDGSRSSVNDYMQDEKGNLVSAFREFSDGITLYETFSFDTLGYKIAEHFSRSDGVKGSSTYRIESNLLVAADFKKFKGWLIGQIQYEYDSCNNLEAETWDFGGQWSRVFHYTYSKVEGLKNYYSSALLSP